MQLCRCPVCHARIGLDALVQDEAGRELIGLLSKLDTDTGAALVGYLGLFRSATRDLSNAKALKLAKDALALGSAGAVVQAMRTTAETLQGKPGLPLSNHRYLLKVLANVAEVPAATVNPLQTETAPKSKTAQTLMALEAMKHG